MNDELFRCLCEEPKGNVIRTVRQLEFSKDNLQKLYEKVSKYPTFLGLPVNNIQDMVNILVSPNAEPKGICCVVDEFIGIFWLTDINNLFDASVHYTFFDGRQRGRLNLCIEAIRWVFNTFKFHRLSTSVPEYSMKTTRFVESIGFVRTGKLRKNKVINGRIYDTLLYDILREEFT